jgi:YYY domain-containing protein
MSEKGKLRTLNRAKVWGEVAVIALLIMAVAGGAYLRFLGVNWDEDQHMHPDERFLSLVQSAIIPVETLGEYFNTATSSLNPANRGYSFFVYGTLPIFIIRYLGEALGQVDYHAITIVGRVVSASFDLFTVLLVYAIGRRLYNRWVGGLGALFYALAVLPIQLSHFMTVDTITNTFAYLAVYAGVWALTRKESDNPSGEPGIQSEEGIADVQPDEAQPDASSYHKAVMLLRDLAPYLLFGLALGAATASKINAVVLAILLPMVEGMRYLRMPDEDRRTAILLIFRNLIVAGVLSFIVFRIGQPYAFKGPGFLNIGIDENWWQSLQNLRVQASGAVDFPPALQWARRPITFSWENLATWGLGLPLGIFSSIAFLAMGWQIFQKREWRRHLPLWSFTGLYFVWQSFSWVRSMRYQVLIYPSLAIFAGWGLVSLWSTRKEIKLGAFRLKSGLIRAFGVTLAIMILLSTAAWAFAFSNIYTQAHTRVAASRWIYQNIPGAITFNITTENGDFQQPLPYRAGDTLYPGDRYHLPFIAPADGSLTHITLPNIVDQTQAPGLKVISLAITNWDASDQVLVRALVEGQFLPAENDWRGASYEFYFEQPLSVFEGNHYSIEISLIQGDVELLLHGSPSVSLFTTAGMALKSPLPRFQQAITPGKGYSMNVQVLKSGSIRSVEIPFLVNLSDLKSPQELILELKEAGQPELGSTATVRGIFKPDGDVRGSSASFELSDPLDVEHGQTLSVTLSTPTEGARLVPHAPAPAHESSWDDALPYPVDGFSPYSESGGIYRGDLNFEMYWADDEQKRERFETILDLADFIFITSSRQWGTTTRVPERYPLTTAYYRNLLGCPADREIEWCYNVAQPGMFDGALGFDLVRVFQSNPSFGPIEINDQFSEEAFTVYDHPKVLIFEKGESYDPIAMRDVLRSVDLNKVVYFTPGDAASYRAPDQDQLYEPRFNLMLPEDQLAEQRSGGTWADLFNRESLLNTSEPLAAAVFYLFVVLLGVIAYPVIRMALPGLADRGYPLAKLAGLLLLAFFLWILGSFGVAFSSTTIVAVLAGLSVVSFLFFLIQRKELRDEIKTNWRYFLKVEIITLVAFVFFILVRVGNPDLWHPFKGGEKPMDFSYLNAVLKSTTFPPYDPWFAGGYINYYYYGFLIVGVPIKLLGIVPEVAYNIALAIWYSLLISGAFSVGWNLYLGIPRSRALSVGEKTHKQVYRTALAAGLVTAIGLGLLGNLGTVRLILNGYQRLASAGAALDEAGLGQRIAWSFQGFVQFLRGSPMPFYPGDWYWFPSRVIPGEPITEFPYFTFIYGDLHAHLIAFPITIFAISWSLSVVLSKAVWAKKDGRLKWLGTLTSFFVGGLVIGALRPTNTWDFYTYLVLASAALVYSLLRHYRPRWNLSIQKGDLLEKLIVALGAAGLLVMLATLLYQPFSYWFGQGYTRVEIWEGSRTPLDSYFTHWGLFLFVILSWMAWETYHWMKTTPQSALRKLTPYTTWLYAALILFLILLVVFLAQGVFVGLVAIPIGVWSVILMLRPNRSDGRRFLLFLIGTAATLTLVVEMIYLLGDIGRMNTVFKFYLQAWILFGLTAGVCLVWVLKSLKYWNQRLAFVWQAVLFVLVISAALFTVMGTTDKIRDRMAMDSPRGLNGMAFMPEAIYYDMGLEMQLVEDYQGIRWLQDNVEGSPVILEGQAYEYRWGNRYTIYTGLPGVVGWNWHQRQQRAVLRNNIVQERVDAVNTFYTTLEQGAVLDFIKAYDVSYIILGKLERIFYPGPGLEKFDQFEGILWEEVFRFGDTVIYQVFER